MSRLTLAVAVMLSACAGEAPVEESAPPPQLTVNTIADLPPEFQLAPSIQRAWVDAGFSDGAAYGQAFMLYWANRADETVSITVRYGTSTVNSGASTEARSYFIPAWRDLWAAVSRSAGNCGYTVDATSQHRVAHEALLTNGWLRWGDQQTSRSDAAAQAPCEPGCEPTTIMDPNYDPFDPNGGCGTPGGGDIGGECSNEYVVIEIWNETTGVWETWWEGYVPVC
jgi:hypothetical protein